MLISDTSMIFFASFSSKEHLKVQILECLLFLMEQLLTLIVTVQLIPIQKYKMIADRQQSHRSFLMHYWTCGRLPLQFLQKSANILGFALLIIMSGLSAILWSHHLDDVVHTSLINSAKLPEVISSLEQQRVKEI